MRATPTFELPPDGAARARNTRWVWLPLLAACLVANAYIALSTSVAVWWAKETTSRTSTLPAPVKDALSVRPQTSEADVHVVLWFAAGVAAMFAVRSKRFRVILLCLLVVYSGVLELAQTFIANRTAQWSDFVGNAFGLLAAVIVAWAVSCLSKRRPSNSLAK